MWYIWTSIQSGSHKVLSNPCHAYHIHEDVESFCLCTLWMYQVYTDHNIVLSSVYFDVQLWKIDKQTVSNINHIGLGLISCVPCNVPSFGTEIAFCVHTSHICITYTGVTFLV